MCSLSDPGSWQIPYSIDGRTSIILNGFPELMVSCRSCEKSIVARVGDRVIEYVPLAIRDGLHLLVAIPAQPSWDSGRRRTAHNPCL